MLSNGDLICVLLSQEYPPQGCDFRPHLACTVQGQGGRDPQNLEEQPAENPATGEVPPQPGPSYLLSCVHPQHLPCLLCPSPASHTATARVSLALAFQLRFCVLSCPGGCPSLSCGPITDTRWWPTPTKKPGTRCCSGGRRPGSWSRRCVPGSAQLLFGRTLRDRQGALVIMKGLGLYPRGVTGKG